MPHRYATRKGAESGATLLQAAQARTNPPVGQGFFFSSPIDIQDLDRASIKDDLWDFLVRWKTITGDKPYPRRDDFSPADHASHLGWVLLIEEDGDDFRYRLIGSKMVALVNRDSTGKSFRDIYPEDHAKQAADACRHVLAGKAIHTRFDVVVPGRDFLTMEALLLPMSRAGDRVDMVIARYAAV